MNYGLYVWEVISYTLITITSSLVYTYFKYQEENSIKRLFIPKNDSIWERIKVLLSSYIIIKLVELIFVGLNPNILFGDLISLIVMSIINPVVFILIFNNTKYDIIIQNIVTNIICIIVGLIASLLILSIPNLPTFIGFISIIGNLIFIIFYIVATYFQTDDLIFLDPVNKKNKLKKDI